jgi:hypothetical protein
MENVSISLSVMETKYHTKEICEGPAVDSPAEKGLGLPARSPASRSPAEGRRFG